MQLDQTSDGPEYVSLSCAAAGKSKEQLGYLQGGSFTAPLWRLCRHPCFLLLLFCVESTSVGYVAMAYCVYLSLVLILVVKVLGGGSTSSKLW